MRLVAFMTLLISTSVLACPNLAGRYASCRSTTGQSSGSVDMVITQSTNRGITTYTMTATDSESQERSTDAIKSDGKPLIDTEVDPESGLTLTTSMSASCTATALNIKVNADLSGTPILTAEMKVTKVGNQLQQVITGMAGEESLNDTVICE